MDVEDAGRVARRAAARRGAVLAGAMLVSTGVGPATAQEERIPTIPAGVAAVVLPVQGTQPTAGGAWLGGGPTDRETRGLLDAELAFAFGEEEGAAGWVFPADVKARLARNPMIRVDPERLAYHGLVRKPQRGDQIYEPLHTQLRQIAALFDARIVVLPMVAWYQPPTEEERLAAVESGRVADGDPVWGRAVLLTAIIDVRRSAVLWHGLIEGDPGEPSSRTLLTTLALRAAHQLAPS